jgi:hypothetical protein
MGNPQFSSSTPGRAQVVDRYWLPLEPGWAAAEQSNGSTVAPRMFGSNSCVHSLESLADICKIARDLLSVSRFPDTPFDLLTSTAWRL